LKGIRVNQRETREQRSERDAPRGAERALYEEYVADLDDLPILTDPVAIPAPRATPPDFRRGERRDVRRHPREDGITAREHAAHELAALYDEYLEPVTGTPMAREPMAQAPVTQKPAAASSGNKRPRRRPKKRR
jgi:hypothetical protein